ncbi:unnamed protein product, partial [Laminaria digitata]
ARYKATKLRKKLAKKARRDKAAAAAKGVSETATSEADGKPETDGNPETDGKPETESDPSPKHETESDPSPKPETESDPSPPAESAQTVKPAVEPAVEPPVGAPVQALEPGGEDASVAASAVQDVAAADAVEESVKPPDAGTAPADSPAKTARQRRLEPSPLAKAVWSIGDLASRFPKLAVPESLTHVIASWVALDTRAIGV